jgi:hypothetical protein
MQLIPTPVDYFIGDGASFLERGQQWKGALARMMFWCE